MQLDRNIGVMEELAPVLLNRKGRNKPNPDKGTKILDSDWLYTSFMVSEHSMDMEPEEYNEMFNTTARFKFYDTSLGGNLGINARPQFTQYSDLPPPNQVGGAEVNSIYNHSGDIGMGRIYSEWHDDPARKIYMKFGVPHFRSVISFYSNFVIDEARYLAATGKLPSVMLKALKLAATAIGFVVTGRILIKKLGTLAYLGILATSASAAWLIHKNRGSYFRLKSTMPAFWLRSSTIMNHIMINKGVVTSNETLTEEAQEDQSDFNNDFHTEMPDLIDTHGMIDMHQTANRRFRMYQNWLEEEAGSLDAPSPNAYDDYIAKRTSAGFKNVLKPHEKARTALEALEKPFSVEIGEEDPESKEVTSKDAAPEIAEGDENKTIKSRKLEDSKIDQIKANARSGMEWAIFRVEDTGSQTESITNNTVGSNIEAALNASSSASRSAYFDLAGGNVVGEWQQTATQYVTELSTSAIQGFSMGLSNIVSALFGGLNITLPEHWAESETQLPEGSYTMKVVAPSADPYEQAQHMFTTLSMILSGASPITTGMNSYAAPPICELVDPGRVHETLGMIKSVTVTRGTTNYAWTPQGEAMGIDITFTVVGLSKALGIPIVTGSLGDADDGDQTSAFDSATAIGTDNTFGNYMDVLGARSWYDMVYTKPSAAIAIRQILADKRNQLSFSHLDAQIQTKVANIFDFNGTSFFR